MSCTAYIGLGTNLGDRRGNLKKAVELIRELPDTRVTRHSSLYESEPHGKARNWFVNSVVEIQTTLDPGELLKALQKIETTMGRKKVEAKPAKKSDSKKGAKDKAVSRIIDLDIILYARELVEERKLKIPHPEMANRKFVLLPLSELTPAYVHPSAGVTVSEMLVACKDAGKIHLFKH